MAGHTNDSKVTLKHLNILRWYIYCTQCSLSGFAAWTNSTKFHKIIASSLKIGSTYWKRHLSLIFTKYVEPIFQSVGPILRHTNSWKKYTFSPGNQSKFPSSMLNFPPFLYVFLYSVKISHIFPGMDIRPQREHWSKILRNAPRFQTKMHIPFNGT